MLIFKDICKFIFELLFLENNYKSYIKALALYLLVYSVVANIVPFSIKTKSFLLNPIGISTQYN